MIPARGMIHPYSPRCDAVPEQPSASPLDHVLLAEVGRTLGGARLSELLKLLAVELENKPRVIREAVADCDLHRARHEAHCLKGAAACLGASEVARLAQELQDVLAAYLNHRRRAVLGVLGRMGGAVDEAQAALAAWPLPADRPASSA